MAVPCVLGAAAAAKGAGSAVAPAEATGAAAAAEGAAEATGDPDTTGSARQGGCGEAAAACNRQCGSGEMVFAYAGSLMNGIGTLIGG